VDALRTAIGAFWTACGGGGLSGKFARRSYEVRCDASTTPPDLQAAGQVIVEVKVAPTVPYEFVVIRLGITNDELLISEVTP
jgi:phage tail sheath protein FI